MEETQKNQCEKLWRKRRKINVKNYGGNAV